MPNRISGANSSIDICDGRKEEEKQKKRFKFAIQYLPKL